MPKLQNIHIINFFRKMITVSHFLLAPLFLHGVKDFNGWEIGMLASIFGFAPILVSFPAGVTNDRFSIKGVMKISLIILGICFATLDFADNFFTMAIIFLITGIATSTMEMSSASLFYKDQSNLDVNAKFGNYAFWIALGASIGVISGGVISYFASFRYLYFLYGLIFFLLLPIVNKLPNGTFHVIRLSSYKKNLFNKKTLLFLILAFTMTMHWGVESTVYSPFLKNHFNLNNLQISIYISLPLIAIAIAALAIKRIRYNTKTNKNILLAGFLFSGVGHILMVNQNIYFSFASRVVHEFGDGLINAMILIVVAHLFEKESIGGSSGIFITFMTLGSMVGALIFSPLGYNMGFGYAFIASGILLLIDMVFCHIIFKFEDY